MTRLRSYELSPPGGYRYVQPNEPDGKGRVFRGEPMIEQLSRNVSNYRKGNGLPRASYAECLEDVDRFMANIILKSSPTWTVQIDADSPDTIPLLDSAPGLKPCVGCGIPIPSE